MTGLQLNVSCFSDKSRLLIPSVVGVKNGPVVMQHYVLLVSSIQGD